MIYFDNAASSFPKPPSVSQEMVRAVNEIGANPGRGSHTLAREAANIILHAREKAAKLFGCTNPKQALFYSNATVAINQAIKGLSWERGDHIITTSFEHNSIRRPTAFLAKQYNVDITHIEWKGDQQLFVNEVLHAIRPSTKLVAMTHASNVTGAIIPIEEVIKYVRQQNEQIITLIDGSQTVGHIPVHMKEQGIDMLAFPGHKGLLGPQGTGMLLIEGDISLTPLHHGGTGNYSEDVDQPKKLPERLESGTLNTPGIAGLHAALLIYEERMNQNVPRETFLVNRLWKGLNQLDGVTLYGPDINAERIPIIAFNVLDIDSQEIAMILDSTYNIAVRAGLHCSPLAHEMLETMDRGVVRVSLSMYNTEKEVEKFLAAIQEIIEAYRNL
ncbi:aminotransferase class V-fold PLP-dependent enzyme [Oceanobacillus halotolerans]|uniref:aminotransferase class V-fold PLP-dependent enzyme n=1 Tax=Oceanobacillus halotolerans TaxID=2663380 RepID=UPI0013D18D58|nr:aminotransferase class V-fold PLP-dependent enzyme [Oceanobacillus halotolerans]